MEGKKIESARVVRMARRLAVAVVLVIAAAFGITSCSNQLNDQGGVPQASADYELTYLNVANFPNITLVCIKGVGFATTTRDNNAAIQMVPEWNAFCATKEPATPLPAPVASSTP